MSAYAEASRAVFEVFRRTTPLVEGISIDEAFLDVGGLRRISGSPVRIAERLRRNVREQVGLPITVGVARTKFLAKVASAVGKPDGLLVVPPDREIEFLHPLPVERLWGVGRSLPASCTTTVSGPSRNWRRCPNASCRRWWGRGRPGTCTPWRGPATRGECRPAAAAGPSARSTPSAAATELRGGRVHGRGAGGSGRAQTARGRVGVPHGRAPDAVR